MWARAPWESTTDVVLECRPLALIAPHFFTTRALQLRGDSPRAEADWARVADGIGVSLTRLQRMHQVHGCATSAVRLPAPAPRASSTAAAAPTPAPPASAPVASASSSVMTAGPEADALVTDARDVALVVRVADCVPLLMADPRTGAVAAVHAGWRGTAAAIAASAVKRLQEEYGSDPADLVAAIGPAIGACCYQVGPEVREAFLAAGHAPASVDAWFAADPGDAPARNAAAAATVAAAGIASASVAAVSAAPGVSADRAAGAGRFDGPRFRLDTWAANRDQLVTAGLRPDRVHVAGLCTMTHLTHFYSYRAEGTSTGRLLGVIRRSA